MSAHGESLETDLGRLRGVLEDIKSTEREALSGARHERTAGRARRRRQKKAASSMSETARSLSDRLGVREIDAAKEGCRKLERSGSAGSPI